MKRLADLPLRIVSSSPGGAEAVVVLDSDFAGFAGHFPGAPVMPGMCHVDLAVRAAAKAMDVELDLVVVDRARFIRKVSPDEELRISLVFRADADRATTVTADHWVGMEPVAAMRISVTRRTDPPAPR